MGALGGLVCKFFKIRNSALSIAVSVIGILIYTYFKWAAFVSYAFAKSYTYIVMDLLLDPIDLLAKIIRINEEGTWSYGINSPPVTGIVLAIIWIVEFLIYSITHLFIINDKTNDPFIEKENKWAKKLDAKFFFRDFNVKSNLASIENNPGFLLTYLEAPQNIVGTGYLEAELFHSSDFSENYLDVDQVIITNASRNNRQNKKVIKKLAVSREFVSNLMTQNGMTFPG